MAIVLNLIEIFADVDSCFDENESDWAINDIFCMDMLSKKSVGTKILRRFL